MAMMGAAVRISGGRVGEARSTLDAVDAGDRFIALADADLDRLFRLAGLILGNRADAEDAVGDALLRGWRAAGSLRSPTEFQAWLDRILVNVCRDRLRRRATVRFVALDVAHDRPGQADGFRDLAERDELLGVLSKLPADERIVVVLHYWADLTLEGVSDRLGWPVGTVKSRLHRALGRIREALPQPEAGR
jgi:RNA polymerase sigma-70 factor (ECF subfamily)